MIADGLLPWTIKNRPGPFLQIMQSDPKAKKHAEERLWPILRSIAEVRDLLPADKNQERTQSCIFGTMPYEICGPSLGNVQSDRIQTLVIDEAWILAAKYPGRLKEAMARLRIAERQKISLALIITQGGIVGDDAEVLWNKTDQCTRGFTCPGCATWQPYEWQVSENRYLIRWDTNERTRPNGHTWNEAEVEKTIRLECPKCQWTLTDTPENRDRLRKLSTYSPRNPSGRTGWRGHMFNDLELESWSVLCREWREAMEARQSGDDEPQKQFVQKRLARFWDESVYRERAITVADSKYATGEPWPDKWADFMGVDVQKDCRDFWWVIRSVARDGRSRLAKCGRCSTFQELRKIQLDNAVGDARLVIDARYESSQVFEACCNYGWTALMGEDKSFYPHYPKRDAPAELRYYSEKKSGDPGTGTVKQGRRKCLLYMFAKTPVQDRLQHLLEGQGLEFGIPRDVDPVYLEHLSAVSRIRKGGKILWETIGKKDDHLRSCEALIVAAMMIQRLIKSDLPAEKPKPVDPEKETAL